jgi:hypothetical protein
MRCGKRNVRASRVRSWKVLEQTWNPKRVLRKKGVGEGLAVLAEEDAATEVAKRQAASQAC